MSSKKAISTILTALLLLTPSSSIVFAESSVNNLEVIYNYEDSGIEDVDAYMNAREFAERNYTIFSDFNEKQRESQTGSRGESLTEQKVIEEYEELNYGRRKCGAGSTDRNDKCGTSDEFVEMPQVESYSFEHTLRTLISNELGELFKDPIVMYPTAFDMDSNTYGRRVITFAQRVKDEDLDKFVFYVLDDSFKGVKYNLEMQRMDRETPIEDFYGATTFVATPEEKLTENRYYYLVLHDLNASGSDKVLHKIHVKPFHVGNPRNQEDKEFISDVVKTEDGFIFSKRNGEIIDYIGTNKNIVIPEKIEGFQVNSIANSAFLDKDLRSVKMNSNVLLIGSKAFAKNPRLESVTLNEGLMSIGENAFSGCGLKELKLPSTVTSVGDFSFYDNDLESVSFSEALSYTGYHSFSKNNIKTVDLANTRVPIIGFNAFSHNQIDTLKLPSTLRYINARAFADQSGFSLKDLRLDLRNVVRIGSNAFSNFSLSGVKVQLGNNLEMIAHHAFENTQALSFDGLGNTKIEEVYPHTFANVNVSHLRFPQTLKRIREKAIHSNFFLSKVELPNKATIDTDGILSDRKEHNIEIKRYE